MASLILTFSHFSFLNLFSSETFFHRHLTPLLSDKHLCSVEHLCPNLLALQMNQPTVFLPSPENNYQAFSFLFGHCSFSLLIIFMLCGSLNYAYNFQQEVDEAISILATQSLFIQPPLIIALSLMQMEATYIYFIHFKLTHRTHLPYLNPLV